MVQCPHYKTALTRWQQGGTLGGFGGCMESQNKARPVVVLLSLLLAKRVALAGPHRFGRRDLRWSTQTVGWWQ